MFLNSYDILSEAAKNEEVYADGEDQVTEELENLPETEKEDEEVKQPAEAVPVVAHENAEGVKQYFIEAGMLFKFMKSNGISSIEEGFKAIKEENEEEIDDDETYLAVDAEELEDEPVEEALNLIRALKESNIKFVLAVSEGKEEDDCEEGECEDEEKTEEEKKSEELKDELKDVEKVEESVLTFTEAMVPIAKKNSKLMVEFYYLKKYMKRNEISTIKEAVEKILAENCNEDVEEVPDSKAVEVVVNPDDVENQDAEQIAKEIKEAKIEGINMTRIALDEASNPFSKENRLKKAKKNLAEAKAQLAKLKKGFESWKKLDEHEKEMETKRRQVIKHLMWWYNQISAINRDVDTNKDKTKGLDITKNAFENVDPNKEYPKAIEKTEKLIEKLEKKIAKLEEKSK